MLAARAFIEVGSKPASEPILSLRQFSCWFASNLARTTGMHRLSFAAASARSINLKGSGQAHQVYISAISSQGSITGSPAQRVTERCGASTLSGTSPRCEGALRTTQAPCFPRTAGIVALCFPVVSLLGTRDNIARLQNACLAGVLH